MSSGDQPPPAYYPGYPSAPISAQPGTNQPPPGYAPPQYGVGYDTKGAAPPPAPPNVAPYPGQSQPHATTVNVAVMSPNAYGVNRSLGSYSAQVNCQHCHAYVSTNVHYETGTLAWLLCLGLCCVGCDLGCCLIPFCVDQCKDAYHTCPNCNASIGTHSALEGWRHRRARRYDAYLQRYNY
ncbi:lipopolysaccharide-induced tumor necrosis factor-alpha factor homolog [Symsagittifera roscoffensis]|uniref:lipopolysaccharide-induced tumor necrosis factor-alpha factor homolog n=1 Tax=Symsagittifera roscoffensis TaxID=84072 RepID=UPI00307BBEC3